MLRAKAVKRLKIFHWRRLWSAVSFRWFHSKKFACEQERLEYQLQRQRQKAEATMRCRPF